MDDLHRRREDKPEDEQPPIPGYDEGKPDELPLHTKAVKVARFNRKMVAAILTLVTVVTAIALIFALKPKPKKTPEQIAQEQAKRPGGATYQPALPESVAGAPANYGEASKGVPKLPFPPGSTPQPGTVKPTPEPGAPTLPGTETPGTPGYVPAPAGAGTGTTALSPKQQRRETEAELKRKEAIEARKSPVVFPMGGTEPPQTQLPLPALPALPVQAAPAAPAQPPVDDQNQQEEKRAFLKPKKDSPYVETTLLKPISPYEIKAGTIFPATLLTGINSDLPGQIVAQSSENVYDTVTGRFLLIPQGTRIVGEYDSKVAYGQERVLVVWSRLILPNGNSISLEGMPGVDLSGYSGLKDRVNNHYWKLISGVVLGSVLGAGAQVAVGGQGSANTPPSFGQLAVSGAAGNLNQAGQRITEKNLNLQPTIEIRPGMNVNVFATKDMIMQPYERP